MLLNGGAMKNIFRLTCLVIGLGFAALPAQAVDFKPYAGVGMGSFIIDAGVGSENAFGGYGILGADLHENYGVELRFGTTGNTGGTVTVPQGTLVCTEGCQTIILPTPTPATISVDWFVAYLFKLQYPIAEAGRIYGLVGATTLKSKLNFPALGRTGHTTKTTFSFGGGADYGLGNQWRLGLDAMVYANDADTNAGAKFKGLDVWAFTATATYGF
jgi:hypothetical protein